MEDAEVVIIGAGAAGLSLARRLAATRPAGPVVLLEPPDGPLRSPVRTWCWWEAADGGEYDAAVRASWDRIAVHGPAGERVEAPLAPLRYKMLRSDDFETLVAGELAGHPAVHRLPGAVTAVHDGPRAAEVVADTPGGVLRLRARWVFDSRPPRELPPARTRLLQHFRGWFVRTAEAAFDPAVALLMDFRVPQPSGGLAFGYVLPTGPRGALVEYTRFSADLLGRDAYDAALDRYVREVLGLGRFRTTGTEQGAIPMTDGAFPRRVGARVFRIGTAGGATRPATGYTFSAIQRQSRGIAQAYAAGRVPVPPPPHRRRHLTMDAALLRALDRGRLDGAAYFTGLFRSHPPGRLLRFLDGGSTLREEAMVGLRGPVVPMALSCAELPLLRRRPRVGRPG
ncbi:lycopene cyclase family protein [Peterkaempfera bronchialis]|uniref:Lycopene cyclase n=1 Tax=Peterkaempfera bronchialis TaxID=2126346 RepID=A0A345SS67_9ACTN|nr:lycopene cyclase family protein [Peterkaempfera bronchialis]AXI76572.1 lycopene cyclase [Peterkaempfera bronchialis]